MMNDSILLLEIEIENLKNLLAGITDLLNQFFDDEEE